MWHELAEDIFSGALIKKGREFSTHVGYSVGEAVTVNNNVYPSAKTKNVKGLRLNEPCWIHPIAQSVKHETLNFRVVGSSLTLGTR